MSGLDAAAVHYVARRLLAAAREAIAPEASAAALSPTERLALQDLVESAPTTVQEIARRTRIAQSRVSAIVAKWRARGAIDVEVDAADRRRTLLSPSAALAKRALKGAGRPADGLLKSLCPDLKAAERQRVVAALSLLYARLKEADGL